MDNKIKVIDNSYSLKEEGSVNLAEMSLIGDTFDLSHDQQKLYLAQGSEGFVITDVTIPKLPINKGKLLFVDLPTQLADKTYIIVKENFKVLLLNDEINGLKVITENYNKVLNDQIKFYAKGLDGQVETKLIVRVNGEILNTVTIDDDNYMLYTVVYNRNLTVNDNVEIILYPSVAPDKNYAFVSYININNHYCYQEDTLTEDSIGLINNLQTISVNQGNCISTKLEQECTPGMDKFPAETCNLSNNLIGKKVCNELGLDYTCEDSATCQMGFVYQNGNCIPQNCTPNSSQSCLIANGSGSQSKCDKLFNS